MAKSRVALLERRIARRKTERKAAKYYKWLNEGRAMLQGRSTVYSVIGDGYWVILDTFTESTLYLPIEGHEYFEWFLKNDTN